MKLVLLLLFLCAATSLLLLNFSLSFHHNILGFSTSRLFVFLVFHTIIFVILAKSYRPSADVFHDFLPVLRSVHGLEEEEQTQETHNTYGDKSNHHSNNDDDDDDNYEDDDRYYYGSDGYDEDDDDDGSDDIIGWNDDEEEFDDNLESRIEGFIAKVITGWKEELLRENLHNNYVD